MPPPQAPTPCQLDSISLVGLPSPVAEPSQAAGVACARTYGPADYWRAYNAVNIAAASNVNIAIMAQGNVQPAIADFRVNETGDKLVQVPVVVKQARVASPDTAGDGEWTLDMIASTGMARNVKTLYVYDTTSLTDSDITLEYSHFVTDNLAPVGNSSFGWCEYGPHLDGSMLVDDELLLQGAAQGQTMFVSTGDSGSFCSVGVPNGVPAGAPLAEYPAASPYVVAVGGTTLLTKSDGSYQGEVPWYSGGGGVSQFEYSPYWEAGTQPIGTTATGQSFRGLPDISLDADLQTGMNIYSGGSWTVTGGTSLASPLGAGIWAHMLKAKASAGFAPPSLYKIYKGSVAGSPIVGPPSTRNVGPFHDILEGGNGLYTALPGYDYASGLGSVDSQALSLLVGH